MISRHSPRLRSAVAAYRAARAELIAAIETECPGAVVIRRRWAFYVTRSADGAPQLHQAKAIRIHRARPTSPAE
jgi:hypothetical protein